MKFKEHQQRSSEGEEALLNFQQTAESLGPEQSVESPQSEDISKISNDLQGKLIILMLVNIIVAHEKP